jgi:plasmid rolling circle replication initiator protein Rep
MWEAKSSGAVNVRKNEFIESIILRWKNRISARNAVYEIKKLQLCGRTRAVDDESVLHITV